MAPVKRGTRIARMVRRAAATLAICAYAQAAETVQLLVRATIPAGERPAVLALTPDEKDLYVADAADQSLRIVRTAMNRVTSRIPLGCSPLAIGIAADGSAALVGCTTGLRMISPRTESVKSIATGSVWDLAITNDSKTAYLAEQKAGLWKLDLATRKPVLVDPTPMAMYLALTPDGKYLYLNYQHSGPGGRPGHDAIGKFDAKTGRRVGAITGLANVGDALAISPDGRRLWVDGEDACASRAYDHLGCPAVPAGIVNVIDTATDRLVHSIPLVGSGGGDLVTLSPDGAYAVLNGAAPRFVDSRTFSTVAAFPDLPVLALVFLRDGRHAYARLRKGGVAMLEIWKPTGRETCPTCDNKQAPRSWTSKSN
jgi:YVTN family beta-propeller protein